MLQHGQIGSGTDLGFKLLETFEQASIACNNDSKSNLILFMIGRLLELIMDIPVDYAQHQDFVKSCMRYIFFINSQDGPLNMEIIHWVTLNCIM